MKFQAVLFDFNGLIVNDEPVHYELFRRVLTKEGITLTEKEYWSEYLGYDDKGLFEAIFEKNKKSLPPKKLKTLIAQKNTLYLPTMKEKMKLFPGVVEFIQTVQEKYPTAIVSGALRSEIDFVLKESEITFPLIISADDTKHGKPDPEGFVLALMKLKKIHPEVRPENCLVLEDSLAGIEAAHRTQMKVVALTHTYPRQELGNADWVVDTFSEVELLLN